MSPTPIWCRHVDNVRKADHNAERIAALEAENKRLREALERIANTRAKRAADAMTMADIAREALGR